MLGTDRKAPATTTHSIKRLPPQSPQPDTSISVNADDSDKENGAVRQTP